MTKVAKEYVGIFREDGRSLHIIRLASETSRPYIVCFNFNYTGQNIAEWCEGTSCNTLEQAWDVFDSKCNEYEFKLIV